MDGTIQELIDLLEKCNKSMKLHFLVGGKVAHDYDVYETHDKDLGWIMVIEPDLTKAD